MREMKNSTLGLFFTLLTVIVLLPFLANPPLFLSRGNDLQEFFWPLYYYVKQSILQFHTIPLWNTLFLGGTPLVTDPQTPFYYPVNILFFVTSIDGGIIVSIFLHSLLGSIGMYTLTKRGLRFTQEAAIISAMFYSAHPAFASVLEAGHMGIIQASAWIPWAIFFALSARDIKGSIVLAVVLSMLFFTHLPTAIVVLGIVALLLLKSPKYGVISGIFFLGFVAISLLPQISWQSTSTRSLLLTNPDIYPKWSSKLEYFRALFFPLTTDLSTEKIVTLGFVPSLLAAFGFIKLPRTKKVLVAIVAVGAVTATLGVASPAYSLLVKIPIFSLMRVSSRFILPLTLLVIILASYGLMHIKNGKYIYAAFAVCEYVIISWSVLAKPSMPPHFVPQSMYETLASDTDQFRVFCTTRCLSQKMAAVYNLELVDGYTTLPQKNIYQYGWEYTNSYWNYYTLSIPPMGLYLFEAYQPDPIHLGLLNTKYVISPYELTDKSFVLQKSIDSYYIYENALFTPRVVGAQLLSYSPNTIVMRSDEPSTVIVHDVYTSGWKAKTAGIDTPVVDSPQVFRSINVQPGVTTLYFLPDAFLAGAIISLIAVCAALILVKK